MENNNEKLGQEPAFAAYSLDKSTQLGQSETEYYSIGNEGMSKRFYAACAAMQGLISCNKFSVLTAESLLIKKSFELADELLKQENE